MMGDRRQRVLVLLAAYNGMAWLEEQVESILNQKRVDVELCISVDASNDGTEQWVDQLVRRDPRVSALPHGRTFGGAAKNFFRLMTECDLDNCDYVSLADQDDIWLPLKLERAVCELSKHNAEGYSSNVTAFWRDGRKRLVEKSHRQRELDYLFEAAGPGCTYVMTRRLTAVIRELLEREERVSQVRLHDWLFYATARNRKFTWMIDPEPSMLYRQHESNQVGVNQGWSASFNRIRAFCHGDWLEQSILISSIIGEEAVEVRNLSSGRRSSLLSLGLAARRCRRRPRDQLAFLLLCLVLSVNGLSFVETPQEDGGGR